MSEDPVKKEKDIIKDEEFFWQTSRLDMMGKRIFEDKTLKSSKLKCKEKRKKQQQKSKLIEIETKGMDGYQRRVDVRMGEQCEGKYYIIL